MTMRKTIHPAVAMVCMRAKCALIFEGPEKACPSCGFDGVAYREIEELAIKSVLGDPKPGVDYKPLTKFIQ